MDFSALVELIDGYKSDQESVYNTWFVNGEERLKAFRAIRRGVRDTVESITNGTLCSTPDLFIFDLPPSRFSFCSYRPPTG